MGQKAAELVRELLRSAMLIASSNTQGNTSNESASLVGARVSRTQDAQARPCGPILRRQTKIRRCVKCKGFGKIHRHHITYEPVVLADLCPLCHGRITGLNTKAAKIAYSSKEHRREYTNRLRLVLWNWFINNKWPEKKRISYSEIYVILAKAKFTIEVPSYAKK